MDNISQSAKKINEMYTDLTYFDQYGGSVFVFIVLITMLFLIFAYMTVMKNVQPIKDDWVNQRCKPQVIPFAGLINKPDDMSVIDFTGKNFSECIQNILISITGTAIQPITYITHTISELINLILGVLQHIRALVSSIKSNLTKIAVEIMGRIGNIMVPLQQIIIAVVDSMEKIKGILTAGLYTILVTYYVLKALLGAIVQFIITILIVLAALVFAMWIIPFTWPIAMTMTIIFISISVPLAIIVVFFTQVLHVQVDMSIPGVPSRPAVCFDKNTIIKMENGTSKSIYDITVGEKLYNNGFVTSKMKLDARHSQMYTLHGIIVSSSHMVKLNDNMIFVSNHPDAVIIQEYKEPYIYCLNTSTKEIIIESPITKNMFIFYDWDELSKNDISSIFEKHNNNYYLTNNAHNKLEAITPNLHKYFDGGFSKNTMITLSGGVTQKEIKDIKVGDVLQNNEYVYGIVEIDGDSVESQYEYNLGPFKKFEGGPNLTICDTKINIESSLGLIQSGRCFKTEKQPKLYHLLTNTQTFHVGELKFYDYNSSIELFLEKYRPRMKSIKYFR